MLFSEVLLRSGVYSALNEAEACRGVLGVGVMLGLWMVVREKYVKRGLNDFHISL